uniref:PLAT domain-containing protein n=1 Tax=Kalanchoe fedtschenkoi TaxID=63787 RepID=A0A7N1A7A5_KALFE
MAVAGSSSSSSCYLYAYLLLAIATSILVPSYADDDCVYTIYVRTGSILKGGTDSIISATFSNVYNESVYIDDLELWGGLMEIGHNYFERGNLDIFSGRGPCLSSPICALNLTSDGSGPHHGWYVNYVEVTSTGVHTPCAQTHFTIEQWLATDTFPYELTAIRDYCPTDPAERRARSGSLASSA